MSARRSDRREAGSGDPAWPDVNAAVGVSGDGWGAEARTRVEDRTDTYLVVARPARAGTLPVTALPGETLRLSWTERDARYELQATLSAARDQPVPVWLLHPAGPVRRQQRRASFRLDIRLSALVSLSDQQPLPARVHDLSEGGMRCVPPVEMVMNEGDQVCVRLQMLEEVAVKAKVVRVQRPPSSGASEVGLAFEDVPEAVAERIRHFIFAEQVARRARLAD